LKRKALFIFTVLALLLTFTFATGGVATAASSSQDVAIIGDPVVSNGGTFPTSGFPGGSIFNFTNMGVSEINAANLTKFDTVLLNMASRRYSSYDGCGCNADNIPTQAKADLVQFVYNGGKMIIYDSECSAIDYSWLPYSMNTTNPGATGSHSGTLTIVEENCLSTNAAGPYYINASYVVTSTDAVGDMNVMNTYDPHWCLDMTGTNVVPATGPVHTYARYGSGLFIYNGMDVDYIGSSTELQRIWELELLAPFNPSPVSDLPCGVTVTGLALTPVTARNPVGTSHTVTAHVTDNVGNDIENVPVSFEILTGPNAGKTYGPVNTDADGLAEWTYNDDTGLSPGTDTIQATATVPGTAVVLESQVVDKEWYENGEEPPVVEVGGTVHPVNKFMLLTPWITLGILLAAWGTFILRRRKAQS